MALKPGDQAPTFRLPDQDGTAVSLGDFAGRKLLLYFYPKDDTPGCTTEACQFNDARQRFVDRGVAVIGVSADDGESHRRFRAKYGLEFPLLSDDGGQVATTYGAWGEKTYGEQTFTGVLRSTFLIDEQGRIEQAWYDVAPDGHPEAILAGI
ncbi:MAG: thioredoxin-dependent thiol peroxidase [Candidatus Dormiibacterota bacterium]